MNVVILGCGTSSGVPLPGCECGVCLSNDPKNSRLRPSLLITTVSKANIIVDTSTDFRQQALRRALKRVDAVLFTHAHADHILGLDDLRSFNFIQQSAIPCYATTQTWAGIEKTFHYIFDPDPDYIGGGLAQLEKHVFEPLDALELFGSTIKTFPLVHGNAQVVGFRIGEFAYATDCNQIPEASMMALEGTRVLILDALRHAPHPSHFTIEQAIEVARSLGVERTILTHFTHSIDYHEVSSTLPAGIELGYDGLEIELSG